MFLYPSLMGANQLTLADTIDTLEPWCEGFHLDMMDGHAVPNITGGPAWTNTIAQYSKKPVWVHLMTTDPLIWIDRLNLKPGSMVDFQYESAKEPTAILQTIKNRGYKPGISIAPETAVEKIYSLLPHCNYINVMGVQPGFSGQAYQTETTIRIIEFNQYIQSQKLSCTIACDGGITEQLLPILALQGVTHAALASTLFDAGVPVEILKKYKN